MSAPSCIDIEIARQTRDQLAADLIGKAFPSLLRSRFDDAEQIVQLALILNHVGVFFQLYTPCEHRLLMQGRALRSSRRTTHLPYCQQLENELTALRADIRYALISYSTGYSLTAHLVQPRLDALITKIKTVREDVLAQATETLAVWRDALSQARAESRERV